MYFCFICLDIFSQTDSFLCFCSRMAERVYITAAQFEGIFKEMHLQLFYLAYDIVGDKQVAQDVVSEVFMSLWNRHRDVAFSKLKGYLYVSVRNKSLDWYRRNASVKTIPLEDMKNLVDSGDSWEQREERIRKIERELARMPEKTRLIFDLCYRKRKSYKEAAEIVGISSEGIKKHLQRALKELRSKLRNEE